MIVSLTEELATALAAKNPHNIAHGISNFVEAAREMTKAEQWEDLGVLAQNMDVVIANAKELNLFDTKDLELLGNIAQQTSTVLAFLSEAAGERMTGYFRGALSNAMRVDTILQNQLKLRDLVELVKKSDSANGAMISFDI